MEDKAFSKGLSEIISVTKNVKNNLSKLQTSFDNFSVASFITEMGKLTTSVESSGSWSNARKGLSNVSDSLDQLNMKGANLSTLNDYFSACTQTLTDYATVGNNAFGEIGVAIGLLRGSIDMMKMAAFGDMIKEAEHMQNIFKKGSLSILEANSATNQFAVGLINSYDAITQSVAKENVLIESHKDLTNELQVMTDANGSVKDGYEERAQFIISTLNNAYGSEIQMIDGVIQNYQQEIKSIENIIAKKQQEIALKAAEKQYQLALETRVTTYKNLIKAEKDYNDALHNQEVMENNIKEQFESGKAKKGETLEAFTQRMIKENESYQLVMNTALATKQTLESTEAAYDANVQARINYQGLQTAIATNDAEAIEYYNNKVTNSYYDGKNMITLTHEETLEETNRYHDKLYASTEESNLKIADSLKQGADYMLTTTRESLLKQSESVENLTPNVISTWGNLSQESTGKFLEYFEQIPVSLRQNVIDKMQEQGYEISDELQTGISKIDPTVKIKTDKSGVDANIVVTADTKQASLDINSFIGSAFSKVKTILGISDSGRFANGGIYSNGSWSGIPQYANGGLPSHGTMFIAGERGAEIVGHINGRTEVLNKSQIASAIYTAVATAMNQYGGTNQDIRVYAEEGLIVEKVSKGINQHVKQTGNLPFIIPI